MGDSREAELNSRSADVKHTQTSHGCVGTEPLASGVARNSTSLAGQEECSPLEPWQDVWYLTRAKGWAPFSSCCASVARRSGEHLVSAGSGDIQVGERETEE